MNAKNTTPVNVAANIEVDQEAVLQVAVSGIEESLYTLQDEIASKANELTKAINKSKEDLGKAMTAAVSAKHLDSAKALAKAMTAFKGCKVSAEVESGGISIDENLLTGRVFLFTTDKSGLKKRVFDDVVEVKITKEVTGILKAIDKLKEEVSLNQDEALEVRKRIKDMGRTERRAKAALAASILENNGQADLLKDIQKRVMAGDAGLTKLLG